MAKIYIVMDTSLFSSDNFLRKGREGKLNMRHFEWPGLSGSAKVIKSHQKSKVEES